MVWNHASEFMSTSSQSSSIAGSSGDLEVGEAEEQHPIQTKGTEGLSKGAEALARPRFVVSPELSNLNWKKFASGQEWRRDLLLRGLPRQMCAKGRLEAFLVSHRLEDCVMQIHVALTRQARFGSAVLSANSVDAASRLAKCFHGCQLAGSKLPVAVSFAAEHEVAAHRRMDTYGDKWLEPMRVQSSQGLPKGGLRAKPLLAGS